MKKYIPDLIPEKHRVLTEYFQELPHKSVANSWDNISWLISTILLLGTFWVVMVNFGFGFSLFFTSFIISPWGHKFLERNLEFVLTKNLKLKTIGVISIFTAVTGIQFSHDLRELQEQNRIAELKRITIQKEIQKKERNRLDSLTLYVTEAEKYQKAKKYQKAINLFKEAQKYSIKSDENRIILGLANSYFDVKDYKKASENLNRIDEKSADIY